MPTCPSVDPVAGQPCNRVDGHDYPAHSATLDGGRWYLEWVDELIDARRAR